MWAMSYIPVPAGYAPCLPIFSVLTFGLSASKYNSPALTEKYFTPLLVGSMKPGSGRDAIALLAAPTGCQILLRQNGFSLSPSGYPPAIIHQIQHNPQRMAMLDLESTLTIYYLNSGTW